MKKILIIVVILLSDILSITSANCYAEDISSFTTHKINETLDLIDNGDYEAFLYMFIPEINCMTCDISLINIIDFFEKNF
ncbi:MAG: hypothetical protein A2X64_00875 [Ignavibacteria bacterium GWF2_33_9]|nr:MAG: hypothetical protein A2X64_00875 [Ignavibacteria bacterium GWF2_33_9]